MTRSKTTRQAELSDLSIHLEDDIGPSPGYTLDIINDTGKTNEVRNQFAYLRALASLSRTCLFVFGVSK
jgi:hypothetical protein